MIRYLNISGLAALLTLTFCGLGASSAWAVPSFHCTATSANCFITSSGGSHGTGSNDNKFTIGTKEGSTTTVQCTGNEFVDGAQFKATSARTPTSLKVEATYTGCKAFGIKATVSMNGCSYALKLIENSLPAAALVDISCPIGKTISIAPTGLACTVTIPAQTGIPWVFFFNAGGSEPTDLSAQIEALNITYTTTGTECPEGGGTTIHNNGHYTGTVTLTGFEDNSGVEGKKVGLHVLAF